MDSGLTRQTPARLVALLPPLFDAAALLALLLWLPALARRLLAPSGWNALLLVILYLLFCSGVYLSRKLLPSPEKRWSPPAWLVDRRLRAASGAVFALLMATTLAYQLGFFETIFAVGAGLLEEGSTAALFVYAPGAWLGFSMLVILVLAFPVQATLAPGDGKYPWVAALSLACTAAMLLFSAAQARAMLVGLGVEPGFGPFLLALLAFAVSFLPARVIYLSRAPHLGGWLSLASLLCLAAYLAAAA